MTVESIGGIDGKDKLTSQELKSLQELARLDNTQIKEKVGEDKLGEFKDILLSEKKVYIENVKEKYKYHGENGLTNEDNGTRDKANTYAPNLIDSIINKLGIIKENKEPINKIVDDKEIDSKDFKDDGKESNEKLESTIWEYFDIPKEKGEALKNKLDTYGLDLDIIPLLVTYKNHIENNLKGLKPDILEKITDSIGLRVLYLSKIVDERIAFVDEQIEEGDYKKEGKNQEIKNERWIINSKLKDSFSFVDNELLPSAQILLKYSDEYQNKRISGRAESLYDVENKLEEIEEMFNAKLDKEGNFDEGLWSTQDIFDASDKTDLRFLQENRINVIEGASLLNEKDNQIEANATKWFMLAIAGQIAIEVGPVVAASVIPVAGTAAGAIAGAVAGGTIDIVDTFSDTEVLLDLVQGAGLVDSNYRMEKTWIDNILAGIGLIPGMTVAMKGKKVSEFLSKLPTDEVNSGLDKIKDIFTSKIRGEKIPKFKKPLENIKVTEINLLSIENIKGNLGDILSKLPDSEKIKNTIGQPIEWLKNKFDTGFTHKDLGDIEKTKKHIYDGLDNVYEIPTYLKQEIEKTTNGITEFLEVLKQNKLVEYTAKSTGEKHNGIIEEFQVLQNGKIKAVFLLETSTSKTGQYPLKPGSFNVSKGNSDYILNVDGTDKGAVIFKDIEDFKKYVSHREGDNIIYKNIDSSLEIRSNLSKSKDILINKNNFLDQLYKEANLGEITIDDLLKGNFDTSNNNLVDLHYFFDKLSKSDKNNELLESLFNIFNKSDNIEIRDIFNYFSKNRFSIEEFNKIINLNVGFDFKYIKQFDSSKFNEIIKIIEKNPDNAKKYLDLFNDYNIPNSYTSADWYEDYLNFLNHGIDLEKHINDLKNINKKIDLYSIMQILDNNPNFDFTKINIENRNLDNIVKYLDKEYGVFIEKENGIGDKFIGEIDDLESIYKLFSSKGLNDLSDKLGFSVEKYFEKDGINPNLEIKNILKSNDRNISLSNFKKEFLKQKHLMSTLVSKTESIYEKNPNISLEELVLKVLDQPEVFSKSQKIEIIEKINKYYIKVNKIDELIIEYKGRPKELLEHVYGIKVEGSIEVERHSSGIVFYVNNNDDYLKLHGGENAALSGGFKTSESKIDDLSGSITFVKGKNKGVNSFSETTKIHEARHSLNDIIFKGNSSKLDQAKDEIIAYICDGTSFSSIKNILTKEDDLYNYYNYLKEVDNAQYLTKWSEHKKIVKKAIDNASTIKQLYPDNYLDLLSVTDIKHWGSLIENEGVINIKLLNLKKYGDELLLNIKFFLKKDFIKIHGLTTLGTLIFLSAISESNLRNILDLIPYGKEYKEKILYYLEDYYKKVESIKQSIKKII